MDPSYTALLAFNAITTHFARFSQQRTATQEGDRQRAFQQQQFEAQREEQRRQAKERREQEWAMATRQRQTALELQENQKVLDHWPLRLFPSQILQSHRCDGPTTLRVFLSLPVNGPRDLEGPVRQALQQFLSTHYNFNLGVRPIELLDGAWKDGQFQGAASIKALHERLRSEPTLVLETQMPEGDDHLYINLAYWGPAQDQYLYQTLEKIAYRPLVEDCARAAARQWRQARARLIEQGVAKDNLDADQRFGGVRAANLKRLEQEEALSAAGIGLDQVDLPSFQLVKEDWRAIHQFLITWHCLVMGWIGDLYHFSYWETPPLLPKLLPDLLHPDFPAAVAHAFIDHYCRSYRAVAAERPAWGPELALQLAAPLAALPDPVWAIGQVGQAIQDWLALRGLPPVVGTGVAVIDGFCAEVGAADGPVGPALLLDSGFLAGLCNAIGYLNRSDLMTRLGGAASAAAARQEREHQECKRLEKERQERMERESRERLEHERLEEEQQEQKRLEHEHKERERQQRKAAARRAAILTPQDIHGWSEEQVQTLQRSVAEILGLEVIFHHPLKTGGDGPEMVLIPPGSFLMGASNGDEFAASDENPQHRVTIARPFAISETAVTFEQYDAFVQATERPMPDDAGEGRGNRSVINVSWNDASAYAHWLSAQTGKHYRLPTEAEWEYAARAGTRTRYWWSDAFSDKLLLNSVAPGAITLSGAVLAAAGPILYLGYRAARRALKDIRSHHPFGLFAEYNFIADNAAREWVQDCYHDCFTGAPTDGSEWLGSGYDTQRVLRGGLHGTDYADKAYSARVSYRSGEEPDCRDKSISLRLAQDL